MSIPRLALALALLVTVVRAELEFSGYLRSGESPRFVLTDKSTGQTSEFLSLGSSFGGVTLAEFNAAEETLTVKRGEEVLRLRLKDSRVRDGQPATAPKRMSIHITKDGKLVLDDKPLGPDALVALLQSLSKAGERVTIAVHEPPNPDATSHAAVKSISEAIRTSGLKKWSLQIVDAE